MSDNLNDVECLLDRFRRTASHKFGARRRIAAKISKSTKLPFKRWRKRVFSEGLICVIGSLPTSAKGVITVVSHELDAAGAPKVLAEVISALRDDGWAVVVIGPDRGPYAEILAKLGAVVIVSENAIGEESPAIELSQFSAATICNTAACVKVVEKLPLEKTIWYIHETSSLDYFSARNDMFADLLCKVKQVWAASNYVGKCLEKYGVCYKIVLPSSPDQKLTRRGASHIKTSALVMGSIESRKGQDLVVHAYGMLSEVIRQSLYIKFIGRILDDEYFRILEMELGKHANLSYEGAVSPAAAFLALNDTDVVIVPSRDEPLSLVAIEALSAERVVVCTKSAGISDYLIDGHTGYIGDSAESHDLADLIERALSDRDRWGLITSNGRDLFQDVFAPDIFRRRVIELLDVMTLLEH